MQIGCQMFVAYDFLMNEYASTAVGGEILAPREEKVFPESLTFRPMGMFGCLCDSKKNRDRHSLPDR